jgi:carboxylesterase
MIDYFSAFNTISKSDQDRLYPDGKPFYLQHSTPATTIVLCLHGYTATPFEVRPIADACFRLGIDAAAPLLPGHGYASEIDMRKIFPTMTLENIFGATRAEITYCRQHYKKVFIYGQSMGGIIALAMAEEGLVNACTATAPAIKTPFYTGIVTSLFGKFNIYVKKPPSNILYNPCYDLYSSRTAKELHRMELWARNRLEDIKCPTFIAHTHHDSQVSFIGTEWIQKRVPSARVQWFDRSDHTMPLDVQAQEVTESIAQFLAALI